MTCILTALWLSGSNIEHACRRVPHHAGFMQVAIKMPLVRTLDHELQILQSLQGLGGLPTLAFDSLVQGAIVLTPILQPLTIAAIHCGGLHLAVPALVSTIQVCICKACCSVDAPVCYVCKCPGTF